MNLLWRNFARGQEPKNIDFYLIFLIFFCDLRHKRGKVCRRQFRGEAPFFSPRRGGSPQRAAPWFKTIDIRKKLPAVSPKKAGGKRRFLLGGA